MEIEEITLVEEEISENRFLDNAFIKKINAPNLKKINAKAFYNCINLVEINAPELEYIGDFAFYGTKVKDFNFSKVLEIGKNAFDHTAIESIYLPKTLKKIGKYAFANNPYLVKVEFMPLMTRIKDGMFENCINLKTISFSNTINKLGIGVFKNCRKLNNIILPEHLKIIETNAFWGCDGLKKLEFNKELEFINNYSFGYTKLTDVILPNSIKNIGKFPFYMCSHLENLTINSLFHNEIVDKTNSKLEEIVISKDKIKLVKPIKKIINYNKLIVIRYNDDTFHILAKPIRYYDQSYFLKMFPECYIKFLMKKDEIFNIFYWETILDDKRLKDINPFAIIALPPNINMIKAFFNKHKIYDDIISEFKDAKEIIALIKFITIFGGLCKKNNHNLNSLIGQIGINNLVRQFLNVNVKEFNQNFTNLYLKLGEIYSFKELNRIMPFLYNNIEIVINLKDNYSLDTLEKIKFEESSQNQDFDVKVVKSENKSPNYEWLDTSSIINLLWAYILASVSNENINSNEQMRKVSTYNIKDDNKMIIASSRAYYSAEEKYLLFNSIKLSQSFINKNYTAEKARSLIVDYVLESIAETINFFNEKEVVVAKVNVAISEKSIKEQLQNRGTKVINQNI